MYLVFDTETAGLPDDWDAPCTDFANWPRVVQIAWLLIDRDDHLLESASRIVRPDGFTIPLDAVRVHGITTEDALGRGMPLSSVLSEFLAAVQRSSMVVEHNMAFDGKEVEADQPLHPYPATM